MSGQNEVLLLLLSLFEGKKRCFVSRAVTDVGCHVERLEIVFMAVCGMSFNTRWAPCRDCKPKKGVNLSEVKLKSFLSLIARLRLYSGPSVRKSIT